MRRPEVNIIPLERAGRIALGGAAAIAGLVLRSSGGSWLAVVLEALLVLAGLDLVVTGALRHCPLYHKLGHMPRSLRRTTLATHRFHHPRRTDPISATATDG